MSETKVCVDCKHYRRNWKTLWEPYCARKVMTYTSVITGKTTTKTKLERCTSQRLTSREGSNLELWMTIVEEDSPENYCGIIGRYWEAK